MEIHFIPFEDQYLVYRPLLPLAFVANRAMVRHIEDRLAGRSVSDAETDHGLDAIGFWAPDPAPPDEWVPDGDHHPAHAVLLMTSACNLRCSYCYAFGGEGPLRQMTIPLARMSIDVVHKNARARGLDHFSLTFHGGGEPSTHWHVLTDAVEYARGKDLPCRIGMATNGVLSPEKRGFIIQNFSEVCLSFDGVREVQDAQRPTAGGSGSFDTVMETIRDFDRAGFPYGIRITVTPRTFATLPQSVALICDETNCRGIQVEPAYSGSRGGHAEPDPEQAAAFVNAFLAAFDVSARAGRTLFYSGARPWSVTTMFCRAARDSLVVTPDGSLVGCFEIHDSSHPLFEHFVFGTLTGGAREPSNAGHCGDSECEPVLEIDQGALGTLAAADRIRRHECTDCFCHWHCAGDCAVRRAVAPDVNHGRCFVNRAITKELLAWYIAAGHGIWRGNSD
jgi:uncharacterized protein